MMKFLASAGLLLELMACQHAAGTSDEKRIADIEGMKSRGDGRFDVTCKDGSVEVRSDADISANRVCLPKRVLSISAGDLHTCALTVDGVKCWGSPVPATKVPALSRATAVAAGGQETCAVSEAGVSCWGVNSSSFGAVPALNQVSKIAVGWGGACAIASEGIKCWGKPEFVSKMPPIAGPTDVKVEQSDVCAVGADGVRCWGAPGSKIADVPSLNGASQVSIAGNRACAVTLDGVKCWGRPSKEAFPSEKIPSLIALGLDMADCALFGDEVQCWGSSEYGVTTVPPLVSPRQIAVGARHACALTADGVVCWGNNGYGQLNVPADL